MAKDNTYTNFLGKKSRNELVSPYQDNDIFILTSNYENYTNVVFEAMASGLPVIATNVGGIPSQVKNCKTGLLIELGNIEKF